MTQTKRQIRVGVIGVGSMGRHHARIFSQLGSAELVGVADHHKERVTELAEKYETRAFGDYTELLKEVEAVSIATQTETHFEIGMRCIEEGKHVLIEKPMAGNVEEGETLLREAERRGVKLQVGHVERFNPAIQQLLYILEREKPMAMEARRLSPPIPRGNDVSVVFDLMSHDIDLVLAIARSPIRTMNCMGVKFNHDNLNFVNAQILFQNGMVAILSASKVTERRIRTLDVTCEDAFVEVDLMQKAATVHRRSATNYKTEAGQVFLSEQEASERVFVPNIEPLHEELAAFIGSVVTGKGGAVSGQDGLEVIRVASELERLAQRKRLFQLIDV